MTLVLRLAARRQASPKSCWWACMRSILEYYGQSFLRPEDFRFEFTRPVFRPASPVPDCDPETGMVQPYEWYRHGIPMQDGSLRRACDITGFRPVSRRPAFGSWTSQDVEDTLRRHGPFIFIGNWNRQGFHAVAVVGRRISQPGTANQIDDVIYIDPAMGAQLPVNIGFFNAMMSTIGASPYNPLYFPATPQVRGTEVDRRDRAPVPAQ